MLTFSMIGLALGAVFLIGLFLWPGALGNLIGGLSYGSMKALLEAWAVRRARIRAERKPLLPFRNRRRNREKPSEETPASPPVDEPPPADVVTPKPKINLDVDDAFRLRVLERIRDANQQRRETASNRRRRRRNRINSETDNVE